MSGWVKWEKDLETDPRTRRIVRALEELSNAPALHGPALVTLVCGSLLRLWSYADSHIRSDDTLDMGASEVDEYLGIENFCSVMPGDWLVEVDEHTVKLPDYQSHNGVEAKKKALTQKRVERHRTKERNADALPDQTRPDQKRPDQKNGEIGAQARPPTARRLPEEFSLTESRRQIAAKEGADADREFAKFTDHWRSASGANARKHDWDAAWRNWCRKALDMRGNGRAPPEPPKRTWRPDPADDLPEPA